MKNSYVLVVDDEVDAADLLATYLRKFDLDSDAVYGGTKALEHIKKKKPDLIILDLLMPDMDGYEFTAKLNSDESTANIPIIMLTVDSTQKDKVKALKMGIDDYVIKPYDIDELIARIEVILKRSKAHEFTPREGSGIGIRERKRLEFLKYLEEKRIEKIEPEYNLQSRSGYCYKVAAYFFNASDFSEIEELRHLTDNHVLKPEFFDKILVCPFCLHHDINIRETCPTDHSADISVHDAFHHYRCGYVGTEDEYLQGIRHVCPKCFQELRHVGVDYDRPGKIYVSNTTKEKFTDPVVYCQCRNCKKSFNVDDAVRQNIYAYVVTDRALDVIAEGAFTPISLEQELIDQDVNIYNLKYFRTKLAEEVGRCKTFNRHLSIILVGIINFDSLILNYGEAVTKRKLQELALMLKQSLREVDIPARYDKNDFITLLPEAEREKAESIIRELKEEIPDGLEVGFKIVSFPKDADTEASLIETLINSRYI
ncbi:MAG: response regulator [Pseudomonadota bacterium]